MGELFHHYIKNIFKTLNKLVSRVIHLIYKEKPPKLPEFFFLIGTIFFPQLNVELIIRDSNENNLYTWRDDLFGNKGWHLPGGIIRPNEKIKERVKTVLLKEAKISSEDAFIYGPIAFSELINDKPGIRSHFNSFVFLIKYKYEFESDFLNESNSSFRSSRDVPLDLIKNHHRYINLLNLSSDILLEKLTPVV